MTSAPRLSIVSPCYNEEGCVGELIRRAAAAARGIVGEDFEIVAVNDGSKDRTLEMLRGLAATEPNVTVINLSRNFGQQSALTAGLMYCRGERILILDADLQDPPELLPDMMRLMDEGADVVYGQRRSREGEKQFKKISSRLFYRILQRLIEIDIPLDTGDFRLMNRQTLENFKALPEQFRFVRGLISWVGGKQVPLLYDRNCRLAGQSNWPTKHLIRIAGDAITGFSIVPLRVASYAGIVVGLLSILSLFYTIGSWALGLAVPGWTSLTSIILLIGSVQLLVLGVLGEYLGRLYMESKRRPLFIVHDVFAANAPAASRNTKIA